MRSPAFQLLSRSLRGIGMAVVALTLAFVCSRSEASCGDWLEGHATKVAGESASHSTAAVDGDVERPAQPSRRPCNGPSCGRAPAPVPFAPGNTPVVSFDLERDAILSAVPVDQPQGVHALVAADEPLLPAAFSCRLERPPRAD